MVVAVDIADRMYDYSDEEKAAEAVAYYQDKSGLDDEAIVALWDNKSDPRRIDLEKRIFDAVDANGTAKRAAESIPNGITLAVA